MRSYSPSEQQNDSRHSSRNSSVDRKYHLQDQFERLTRSPEAFQRAEKSPMTDDRPNKNFFPRGKPNNNSQRDNHRRDRSQNDTKDWSQEVEDEENRRRSTRSYEPGGVDRRYRNRR